ncbi:MAG: YARHG domain-containing protein [Prevotellaceae bacterium]|jgi:hypothetical protein|nr:YARHG domain-containing protein [Prevotellaceae bacterium]
MKKILLLLFFICSAEFAVADTIPETLIYRDSVLLFCVHNNKIITITQDKEQNYLLSINGQVTDTLNIINPPKTYWRNVKVYHNKQNSIYFTDVYYGKDKVYNLYRLNLDTKQINIISTIGDYYYIIENTLVRGCDYECGSLIFNNLNNLNIADTVELGDFRASYLVNANKILIGYYESGSIYGFGYYDWNLKKMVQTLPVLDTMKFNIFIDNDGKRYGRHSLDDIDYVYADITGAFSNIGLYWVDNNFNIIQPTLTPNMYYNEFTNTITSYKNLYYYRNSCIKEKNKKDKSVWIACKFTLAFDKALSDIYNNTLLEKTTVEKFDEWELDKLKNMVFAKHGYQFQSEYLQAFFNLIDFYNYIKKKNDVNDLLTPEDKKNLELIEQVSKKK